MTLSVLLQGDGMIIMTIEIHDGFAYIGIAFKLALLRYMEVEVETCLLNSVKGKIENAEGYNKICDDCHIRDMSW